jgi:hypothetical protein
MKEVIMRGYKFIIFSLVIACGGEKIDWAKAKIEDAYRPYAIEKGFIEYKYSGEEEGKETLIFKDYGHWQFRSKETRAQNVPLKRIEIISPAEIVNYKSTCKCLEYKIVKDTSDENRGIYYYDTLKEEYVPGNPYCIKQKKEVKEVGGIKQLVCTEYDWEGSIRPNAMYYVLSSIWDTASPKTKQKLGPLMRQFAKEMSIGFIYAAAIVEMPTKKDIAGKKTTFYKVQGKDIRIFLWNNIILGSEVISETGKKIIVEAIKVDENPKITDDIFKIPADFPAPVKYDTTSFIFKKEKNLAEQLVNIYLSEKGANK